LRLVWWWKHVSSNPSFQLVENITGGEQSFLHGYGWAFGLVMAALVGTVIVGGIKKTAKATDKTTLYGSNSYAAAH
jgi:AGCS family alanine or glycine:cation symporter